MTSQLTTGPRLLKQFRAAAGLTQEQLAGLSGLHVRTIRGMETAHITTPRRVSIDLIGRALGLNVWSQQQLFLAWGMSEPRLAAAAPMPLAATSSSPIDQFVAGELTSCAPVSVSELVTLDDARNVVTRRTEEVVAALLPGVSVRYVLFEPRDERVDLQRLHLTQTVRCQVVGEYVDYRRRVKLFELDLGKSLGFGETHVLRYTADFAASRRSERALSSAVTGEEISGFFRPPASFVLEVQFDPTAIPHQLSQVFLDRPNGRTRRVAELQASAQNSVHIALVDPLPGGHGIVWTW